MRESPRERDLRNQLAGFELALQVVTDEWRRREPTCNMQKGSDQTADLLWKLIELAHEKNAPVDSEWRKLYAKRCRASKNAKAT